MTTNKSIEQQRKEFTKWWGTQNDLEDVLSLQ